MSQIPNPISRDAVADPIIREELLEHISTLKKNKAPGPDNIPNEIYQAITDSIDTLCHMFNDIQQNKRIPEHWKIANIWPIFKSGNPSDWTNYRPIALLQMQYKIFTCHQQKATKLPGE
jgi:hypothetical protein